jgi:hypothetical protein
MVVGFLGLLFIAFGVAQAQAKPKTMLFVGNSFTFGYASGAIHYHADQVHDLNGEGFGGVPALFKSFADQSGLDYDISLETVGGSNLDLHFDQKRDLIIRPWDVVVLHGYSTLDAQKPGDANRLKAYSGIIAAGLHHENPAVKIYLMATWARADQVYQPKGAWYGKSLTAMTEDIRKGYDAAKAGSPYVDGVIGVGQAWDMAMKVGVADDNPYDGVAFGKVDLWGWDQYHGSNYGYYLEALTVFGHVTLVDPRTLGRNEKSALDLGISADQAAALQNIAYQALKAEGVFP